MTSIQISDAAYTTIVLHCAKYPASVVTGVLIGSTKSGAYVVERVVPLQHHWTTLSPVVEAGLSLISASIVSSSSQIIGVYYAPSDVASSKRTELHPTPLKVAQTIASKSAGESIALQINNARLNGTSEHALYGFSVTPQSSQAKHLQPNTISLSGKDVLSHARMAVAQGRWSQLVDFDDHLEDTSLDWLHPILSA